MLVQAVYEGLSGRLRSLLEMEVGQGSARKKKVRYFPCTQSRRVDVTEVKLKNWCSRRLRAMPFSEWLKDPVSIDGSVLTFAGWNEEVAALGDIAEIQVDNWSSVAAASQWNLPQVCWHLRYVLYGLQTNNWSPEWKMLRTSSRWQRILYESA